MNTETLNSEKVSLQILAKAAESYIASLTDDLAKAFVVPQVQKAFGTVSAIVEARWPKEEAVDAAEPEAANDAAPVEAKVKPKSGGMNKK